MVWDYEARNKPEQLTSLEMSKHKKRRLPPPPPPASSDMKPVYRVVYKYTSTCIAETLRGTSPHT